MSDYAEIVVLVEGKTDQIFIQNIVSPYLAGKGVYITPIIISKPGQKGGDVKFVRAKNDIELHLKQRPDTYLTIFVDYYGLKNDWPGIEEAKHQTMPSAKAGAINSATQNKVNELYGNNDADRRFIPYVAMHEFEALLFSDPEKLAVQLGVSQSRIDKILEDCGEPEQIDDSPHTAPSKRLEALYSRYRKTSTGIAIAEAIGLEKIRNECPLFNKWLTDIERLEGLTHG